MYKFYIYFSGLICHMGDDESEKYFAAIVRDYPHHKPRVKLGPLEKDKYLIDPAAEYLKFEIVDGAGNSSISDGGATPSPGFHRFVPSLRNLMGGTPRVNIKQFAIPTY